MQSFHVKVKRLFLCKDFSMYKGEINLIKNDVIGHSEKIKSIRYN
jgi:hypothetical protein